jgi:hypothetical protein
LPGSARPVRKRLAAIRFQTPPAFFKPDETASDIEIVGIAIYCCLRSKYSALNWPISAGIFATEVDIINAMRDTPSLASLANRHKYQQSGR